MRALLPLFLFLTLAGTDCNTSPMIIAARDYLGPSAICTWRTSESANLEIVCINAGRRHICLVDDDRVACVVIDSSPTEKQ